MCLALPARIIELRENELGIADLGGVRKEISLALVEDVQADEEFVGRAKFPVKGGFCGLRFAHGIILYHAPGLLLALAILRPISPDFPMPATMTRCAVSRRLSPAE